MEKQTEEITIDNMQVLIPKTTDLKSFATAVSDNPNAVDLYELELKRDNRVVPSAADISRSQNINRSTSSQGKGLYQIALRAERQALRNGLIKYANQIGISADELAYMVDYLPNARLGYLNKLIKLALQGIATNTKTVYPGDIDYIKYMRVLNDQAKNTLLKIMRLALDPTKDGRALQPPLTKSNIQTYDAEGINTGSYIALKNPGNVYMGMDNNKQNEEEEKENKLLEMMNKVVFSINENINRMHDELQLIEETGEMYSILGSHSGLNEVTKSLIYFRDKLLPNQVSFTDLKKMCEILTNIVGLKRSKYLLGLSNPFKSRGVRIPTLISPPSATFTIRSVIPLTTNALGNVAFAYNPFCLAAATGVYGTFFVNNNGTLSGNFADNFFLSQSVGQTLPADFYVKYRLVSAGLRIYCYPSSNNDNGILVTSVTFEDINITSFGAPNANLAQFGAFNQIENGYFKQTTTIASREVQEHSYIPLDESFWDYQPVQVIPVAKLGFGWVGYITGGVPTTTIARAEIVANYEALLDNQYTDYLPSESTVEDIEPKRIFTVINEAKKADNLSPRTVSKVFEESSISASPESEIKLPASRVITDRLQESIRNMGGLAKEVVAGVSSQVSEPKKSNWFSNIIETVSPYLSSIIGTALKTFIPGMPLWMKLGKGMLS